MGSRLEANSSAVRKRIENHTFANEEGEEYEASAFGGFPDYFRRKKLKLQNLDVQTRSENADKPKIFRGIVAHVNGYTQPSLNDLHTLIVTHGGGFMQYLDGKTQVTHIIASSLTPKKAEDFKKYRIVKPAWIVDSVNAGKILPWKSYRVVDEGSRQKILKFDETGVTTQVNQKRSGYRDQTEASWYTKQLANSAQDLRRSEYDDDDFDDFSFPSSAIFSDQETEVGKAVPVEPAYPEDVPAQEHSPGKKLIPLPESDTSATRLRETTPISPVDTSSTRHPSNDGGEAKGFQHLQQNQDLLEDGNEHSSVHELTLSKEVVDESRKRKNREDSLDLAKRAKMTAEDHNRELLSDPRIRKSSVLNPDFLEQYYRESRLHHLSTWKADLKSKLQARTAEKTTSQKARQRHSTDARRYILHVDFDSFFVAVSLKNHPQLRDKPAVVAHGAGSGSEIASCNYVARKYGVKNGMWMKRAQEICDGLEVLPYDFPGYEAASRLFYDAILDTGGIVQSVSIDEALADISEQCVNAGGTDGAGVQEGNIWREQARADEIAQALRDRVKRESGCAVSVGIGGNILIAKVALRKAKPAGQHQVKPENALEFLGSLEVQSLPGVAYSIGRKLEEIGIKFVKDIREVTKEKLVSVLGPKTGEKVWNYSRGIDRTEVGDQVIRKSVSAEVNWGVRFETQEQVEEFMVSLSGELSRRLLKEGVKGRNLTMKVMRRSRDAPMDPPKHLGHGKCDIYNKSILLGVLTNNKDTVSKEAISILRGFGFSPGELRGLGIQMTKLEPIKAPASGNVDGSQRRLQFNVVQAPGKQPDKPNQTLPQAPEKDTAPKLYSNPTEADDAPRIGSQFKLKDYGVKSAPRESNIADNLRDDPETPRRLKTASMIARSHIAVDSPSRKPLNTLGTQFIMPTQADPDVVAELPPDIRSKLGKPEGLSKKLPGQSSEENPGDSSEDQPLLAFTALPNRSQIDPEILDSLPDDVRREILSQYQKSPTKPHSQRGQSILPQSPKKSRTTKTLTTSRSATRGRPRGGSLVSRLRGAALRNDNTLTQANFVKPNNQPSSDAAAAELSEEFLDALPDDVRAEVVANHKREQRKRTGRIEVSKRRRGLRGFYGSGKGNQAKERIVRLERRPPPPTFTQQKLSEPDDLRGAITSWLEEFHEEGPYQEDVEALCKYLKTVVVDEGNMRKAVDLVRWLAHVIDQDPHPSNAEKNNEYQEPQPSQALEWTDALETVKTAVNEAVKSKGIGMVDFDL